MKETTFRKNDTALKLRDYEDGKGVDFLFGRRLPAGWVMINRFDISKKQLSRLIAALEKVRDGK